MANSSYLQLMVMLAMLAMFSPHNLANMANMAIGQGGQLVARGFLAGPAMSPVTKLNPAPSASRSGALLLRPRVFAFGALA